MLCPFTFLQGFKKISETIFKLWSKLIGRVFNLQSGQEYKVGMVIFNIYYVQRATPPEVV